MILPFHWRVPHCSISNVKGDGTKANSNQSHTSTDELGASVALAAQIAVPGHLVLRKTLTTPVSFAAWEADSDEKTLHFFEAIKKLAPSLLTEGFEVKVSPDLGQVAWYFCEPSPMEPKILVLLICISERLI